MAISWGKKIFLLYTGFILLIGTLIWKSSQTKFDLVSEDYYEQEVGFQKKLDAQGATAALSFRPVVSLTADKVLVFFPQEFQGQAIIADVKLYNAASAALDRQFPDMHTTEGRLEITRKGLPAARYTMQLSWTSAGKAYYQESPLNLVAR